MSAAIATSQTILVVGAGISGITAALEAAECGHEVLLVERSPALGGRTARMHRYFPKLCHPGCGLEINLRRLENARVRVFTMTELVRVTGSRGSWRVCLKTRPRYVDARCTACGDCAAVVTTEVPDEHEYGLRHVRAAYLPHAMAWPKRYVLDPSIIGTEEAQRAKDACRAGAIDLEMREEVVELTVGAVVLATGWKPYDAAKIHPYGYGRLSNVITSVEFERLADPAGPTGGRLLRPSDQAEATNVAFVQCAGSRDENHLRHCSRVCCMASLKHTQYVRERAGEKARSTIYYIDIRAIDRFEDFHRRVRDDVTVRFIKSKVARIVQNPRSGNPVLHGVDTEGYHRYANEHDLVVLAVGMQPESLGIELPDDLIADSSGFIEGVVGGGLFAAGSAATPLDVNRSVQSATGAALRAIQAVRRNAATQD